MEEDVSFDFDAASLLTEIKSVTDKWKDMTSTMKNTPKATGAGLEKTKTQTKSMGKSGKEASGGWSKAMGGLATKIIGVGIAVALVKKAIGAVIANLPEIGRALSISGRIFKRNLLSPLRQELLPLLNSLLAWVRDNRAMFVAWGEHIATAFRIALTIAKMLFKSVKVIFKSVSDSIRGFFGGTTQSLADTIRVIMTKIAAMMIFIMVLLEPVFKVIGKIIGFIITHVATMIAGFIKGFTAIAAKIQLSEEFQKISDALSDLIDALRPVTKVMFVLAKIVGGALAIGFKVIFIVLRLIIRVLTLIITHVTKFVKWLLKLIMGSKEIGAVWDNVASGFQSGADAVNNVVDSIDKFLVNINKNATKNIKSFIGLIKGWGESIGNFFSGMIGKIQKFAGTITKLVSRVRNLMTSGGAKSVMTVAADVAAKARGTGAGVGGGGGSRTVTQNNTYNVRSTDPRAVVNEITNNMKQSADQLNDDINRAKEKNGQ